MDEWRSDTITANGLKIHYYRTGGDKPPVVINHGLGDDGLCWTRVARELQADYDVILPDARGHGKSASGNGDYSSRQRASDLVGLIQALKLDQPVVGGHSMGADTAMHLAANYPDLARGIFLEDPPIFLPGETIAIGARAVKLEDAGKMMARFMRAFKLTPKFIGLPMARRASPTYPDEEIIPWVDSKKRVSHDCLNALPKMEIDISEPFETLVKIQVPILLIIGDKEKMAIVAQETAQKAASVNDRVQVVHLAGASHDIRRTRFDGYMPALKKFLGEIHSPIAD